MRFEVTYTVDIKDYGKTLDIKAIDTTEEFPEVDSVFLLPVESDLTKYEEDFPDLVKRINDLENPENVQIIHDTIRAWVNEHNVQNLVFE